MEVAGVVFRSPPCFSSTATDAANSSHRHSFPTMVQQTNRKSVAAFTGLVSDKISDKGHLQYYNYSSGSRMQIKEKEIKETKKKLKLLKSLSKNLSNFSELGFGLNPDHGLDHQVKGQMISEATEVLLEQLQKLRAEKMEAKRKKKEEKTKKKASRMMMMMQSSSESSSSSSESDCENVVKTSELKSETTPNLRQETTSSSSAPVSVQILEAEHSKKIEVCMGGKCKKSGGEQLVEKFQAAVGGGAAVVGCKCMGKCRDGPNVRVRGDGEPAANPLCIGVGLEDVDTIVSKFFGSEMTPALSNV